MQNTNVESDRCTHLGWRSPASEGLGDHDHLLLRTPGAMAMADDGAADEPLLQFLDPVLNPKLQDSKAAPASDGSNEFPGLLFHEVSDSPVESPAFLWSGEEDLANAPNEPIVFGDRDEAVVFS